MALRVCSVPGCPTLVPQGQGKCDKHRAESDRRRGSSTARGYGYNHQQLRRYWQARLDRGERVHCWRCGALIDPANWDLGHRDDRDKPPTPECLTCNRGTATRRKGTR